MGEKINEGVSLKKEYAIPIILTVGLFILGIWLWNHQVNFYIYLCTTYFCDEADTKFHEIMMIIPMGITFISFGSLSYCLIMVARK